MAQPLWLVTLIVIAALTVIGAGLMLTIPAPAWRGTERGDLGATEPAADAAGRSLILPMSEHRILLHLVKALSWDGLTSPAR